MELPDPSWQLLGLRRMLLQKCSCLPLPKTSVSAPPEALASPSTCSVPQCMFQSNTARSQAGPGIFGFRSNRTGFEALSNVWREPRNLFNFRR